jgi:hypothetical protein
MNTIPIGNNSCPIFAKYDNGIWFAGSAFFFRYGANVFVATADHVVAGHADASFEVVVNSEPIAVDVVRREPSFDLCVLRPARPPSDVWMTLSETRETPGNLTLYAYEFSTTAIENGRFNINPATRIGNCVRIIQRKDLVVRHYESDGRSLN